MGLAVGYVEVTFRQTDSDASNIVGDVELELVAYGFVEWRKEQLVDW